MPPAAMERGDQMFQALLAKLQEEHDKEVQALRDEIERLQGGNISTMAVSKTKSQSPSEDLIANKATLGPRVARPSSLSSMGESGSQQPVPHEHIDVDEIPTTPSSPKPAGDLQDVHSMDGTTDDAALKLVDSSNVVLPKEPQEPESPASQSVRSLTTIQTTQTIETQEPLGGYCTSMWLFVRSGHFELIVGVIVALNFLFMALELQYAGLQYGYDLQVRFFDQPGAVAWPWAAGTFEVMQRAFLIFFSLEMILRLLFLRSAFCKTAFNIIDFVALGASIVELFATDLPVEPTLLRLCRLAKLFRTIRVLKVSGMLDSLSLLARCMSSSGLTLVWSVLFLLVIQLIAAMVICFLVKPFFEDMSQEEAVRKEVYRFYGTFSIAVLTLFEVFFANWSPACRVLVENISEWYSLLFLIYRCGIGFAVINVVNAVFVQQTLNVAKGDEEVLFLEKQKSEEKYFKTVAKTFEHLDTSGDGLLTWAEFEVVLEDPKLRFLLDKLEIAAGDLKTLFDLLDDTGDGEISVHEFIEGITRFKGAAKSLDVGQILHKVQKMHKSICSLERHILQEDRKSIDKGTALNGQT
mmetsp:Transcript_64925/g.152721  ORF Transcript_64925/g.152721 Transcript_64925/m.152721 type:complete len:580 (-) Transcript_64925:299-2038(-)